MPFGGAGDLEVHVAVVIFGAGDVREHGPLAALLVHDESHRDARHGRLDRDAGVHHRHRAAADRRHRRGPVRLQDVRHQTNGVRELVLARDDGRQRAFGERAVAHLAPAGAAEELHLAHRERRKVVVQHESLVELAAHVLDLLLVVGRAERAGDECLCFAAGEDDRAVRAREDARLGPDRANLVELAAVEADTPLEHLVPQHLLLQVLEDALRFELLFGFGVGHRGDQLLEHLIDRGVARQLLADPHRLAERQVDLLLDLAIELVADRLLLDGRASSCRLSRPVPRWPTTICLIAAWAASSAPTTCGFAHFLRACLDHHDAVAGAGDDEVERALLALLVRRVDDVGAVDESDPHAGSRLLERDLRQRQRGRRAGDGQHVGVVLVSADISSAMICVS